MTPDPDHDFQGSMILDQVLNNMEIPDPRAVAKAPDWVKKQARKMISDSPVLAQAAKDHGRERILGGLTAYYQREARAAEAGELALDLATVDPFSMAARYGLGEPGFTEEGKFERKMGYAAMGGSVLGPLMLLIATKGKALGSYDDLFKGITKAGTKLDAGDLKGSRKALDDVINRLGKEGDEGLELLESATTVRKALDDDAAKIAQQAMEETLEGGAKKGGGIPGWFKRHPRTTKALAWTGGLSAATYFGPDIMTGGKRAGYHAVGKSTNAVPEESFYANKDMDPSIKVPMTIWTHPIDPSDPGTFELNAAERQRAQTRFGELYTQKTLAEAAKDEAEEKEARNQRASEIRMNQDKARFIYEANVSIMDRALQISPGPTTIEEYVGE
jgi:hypothetical protein